MYTVHEIKEKLKVACDEIGILEVLDISVEDILERFEDKIEAKLESLSEEFEADFGGDEDRSGSDLLPQRENDLLERVFPDGGYQIKGEYDEEDSEGMDW